MIPADTICAIATAAGRGGVGIVRLSGPKALAIAETLIGFRPQPRYAHYCAFTFEGNTLDQGLALYFKAPHSFTGEDVFEFQGHGGPLVLDLIVEACLACGARPARPGEFSERAFLNDKLDLSQAEAIADLINASSRQAVKQALATLRGAFSDAVHALVEKLIQLRIYVESAIDFPEEEIDFLSDGKVLKDINTLQEQIELVFKKAQQGSLLREGLKVVLAGRPNAGKSTLLNALAEREVAIVTDIEGTTRDILKEHISIDGMPLHIFDTAGLRDTDNEVEKIGIQRAHEALQEADRILLLIDSSRSEQLHYQNHWQELLQDETLRKKLTLVFNKTDLQSTKLQFSDDGIEKIRISAKKGQGIEELKTHLKTVAGLEQLNEGSFSARRRHLDALKRASDLIAAGKLQLQSAAAGELLAEDLRQAQEALSSITGEFSADDLLGEIFSSFCIGK